jgi:Uma2 family endonuclease
VQVHVPGRGLLTEEESNRLFMLLLEDDTEDSPWMVMGSLQWDATADFYVSLRYYAESRHLPWFVAGMTPILYRWPGVKRKKQLAPDVFVALAPKRPRSSFDLDVEGDFPPFILEVVSPSSVERDQEEKRLAYEMLGVREYALFAPEADRPSQLGGFRRNDQGSFDPWPRDDQGRLWSELLSLYLVAEGATIRAQTSDGEVIPTLEEAVEARNAAEAAQRRAEAEIERLRREIERLRGQGKPDAS